MNSYISFIKDKANVNDQAALATLVSILANYITPLALGSINRQNSHIRLVSRKLITRRNQRLDEETITSIIETLTEKIYFHAHAIGRTEAKEIGLPVITPPEKLEEALWNLYLEYEKVLELGDAIDPITLSQTKQEEQVHLSDIRIAVIESENLLHESALQFDIIRRRAPPPSDPKININIGLNLPPDKKMEDIPKHLQEIIQAQINQFGQQVETLIRRTIYQQSPQIGLNVLGYGGQWREVKKEV